MAGSAQAAYTATPNDWACTNKVGGTWTHGRAPSGCDASAFGPDSFVRGNYAGVIFNDAATSLTVERQRYMQSMYPVIRDASDRYLRSRKPAVSARELEAFLDASAGPPPIYFGFGSIRAPQGLSAAMAWGLPQPRPRSAPAGAASSSAWE